MFDNKKSMSRYDRPFIHVAGPGSELLAVSFYFGIHNEETGITSFAKPVEFVARDQNDYNLAPTFTIPYAHGSEAVLQGLMDDLWRLGVRPTSEKGNEGVVAAMKEHVNDLRTVISRLFPLV